jgi:endogenous inhibitor of DNA gyrase (YacG/DUF329 family)
MKSPRRIRCPTCKKEGDWFAGKDGPFCSHRCKLIDLGKWFSEENRVSEPLPPDHLDQISDLPPDFHPEQSPETGQDGS